MLKRIYLFVLVLIAAVAVHGDVAVQSMSLQPTDLTAVRMNVTDLTGTPCAVVRVALPRQGVTFEGNVMGQPEFTGSEYHVAMTEGSKQLKISVPGEVPVMVTFADYGVDPLQSKTTYQLTLLDAAATYTGTIYFSPANASVVVDNRAVPSVDGVATVQLPAGSYPYAVSAPGYQTKVGILTITPSGSNEDDALLRPDRAGAPAPQQAVVATSDPYNGHEYVDLGLPSGLKWATCNVGANKPKDYGEYFAWGETKPKNSYTEGNSVTYKQEIEAFSGNQQYDAATANWGGSWRMPTKEEIEELRDNCTYRWTGDGAEFTSKKNGSKLFFPAAGGRDGTGLGDQGFCGFYWSALPSGGTKSAWCLAFLSKGSFVRDGSRRGFGFPVRPVAE